MNIIDFIFGCLIALAAFYFGYIFGRWKQADKDKADVFNAIYALKDIIWECCKNEEREDWVKGAMHINKMYFDAIFKVFYGKKPNK